MLCYKDKTYCVASLVTCDNKKCYRYLSQEENDSADAIGIPIAFSDFSDGCLDIIPVTREIPRISNWNDAIQYLMKKGN